MTRATFGVIGHVDHGKTSLVRALTGMETDRLPEEKRRGISIALGFAYLRKGNSEIDLIDMPGHERFVKTMIAGASGIGGVLLIVAAHEQIKPQTQEHVAIAHLLGIRHAVIAITKCDLVTPAEAALAAQAAVALTEDAGLAGPPPILTSVVTGDGIGNLQEALIQEAQIYEPPQDRGFYWLPIDRAFSLAGHGTVVTGTLRHGALTMTTQSEVLGTGRPVRLRGLQVHGKPVDEARPGQRVALNLRGIEPSQVSPGSALGAPGLLRAATWFSVHIRLLSHAPTALRTAQKVWLLVGTMELMVLVRLLDRDTLSPGDSCVAQFRCSAPVVIPTRERFVLRDYFPATTIGGGMILDSGSIRLRRHIAPTLRGLHALATDDTSAMITRTLADVGSAGSPIEDLARWAGLAPARVIALLDPDVVVIAGGVAVLAAALDMVLRALRLTLEAVEQAAPGKGLTVDALVATLRPATSVVVVNEAITRLIADGSVRRQGGVVRLDLLTQERAASDLDDILSARLSQALRAANLRPPDPTELVELHARAATVLERLIRAGVVVRTVDHAQRRTVLFHREAIRRAQDILAPLLSSGGLLAKDAGVALGVSRKFSIPLLEHLDSIRFTRRVGDRRVLVREVASDGSSAEKEAGRR
jgi:selenocysteine-specific elongation factor